MSGTSRPPSKQAFAAWELVQQLRSEVQFLRGEVRASRRLALASFGIAMAAMGLIGPFAFR